MRPQYIVLDVSTHPHTVTVQIFQLRANTMEANKQISTVDFIGRPIWQSECYVLTRVNFHLDLQFNVILKLHLWTGALSDTAATPTFFKVICQIDLFVVFGSLFLYFLQNY